MKLRTTLVLGTCGLIAAAIAPAAHAATPQGKLTGANFVDSGGGSFVDFDFDPGITDGGTSFVGLGNDLSGACTDDAGTVSTGVNTFTVVCAHFVASSKGFNAGSPKMRLAFQNLRGAFTVIRVTDNGTGFQADTFAVGQTANRDDAINWVNRGVIGAGHPFSDWVFRTVSEGDYTVAP